MQTELRAGRGSEEGEVQVKEGRVCVCVWFRVGLLTNCIQTPAFVFYFQCIGDLYVCKIQYRQITKKI